jgi:iron complex outermembrane receptor protein
MKMFRLNKLSAALLASSVAMSASAAVLEEVVITAQKREQGLQDVGISVSAMTGDQMEALGFDNAQQVTAMAPGVSTVQPNGEANYSIAIRGVASSDFTTNVESPVAMYVDEVYISQMSGAGFALFDMERVEILRGPQGTLFGRNATGGLAHFITRKPSQEADGYAKVTLGDYNQIRFEGAAGGAITDNLSARVSVATHDNDGYITNRLGGDLNNANDRAGRVQFLYTPSDETEILLNARFATQDIDTGFFENVSSIRAGELTPTEMNPVLEYIDNDGDVFAGDYDDPGFNDLETSGYTLTVSHDMGGANLTSITDFSSVERSYIEDSDASPVSLFNFFLTTDAEQFSQELRLDGETDTMKWVAGFYYLDLLIEDSNGAITEPFLAGVWDGDPADDPFVYSRDPFSHPAGNEAGFFNPYTSDLQSTSLFGQLEFALSDNLTLIAGARWIEDEKEFSYSLKAADFVAPDSGNFDSAAFQEGVVTLAEYEGDRKDTEISARLQLDYRLSDETLLYTSWNRGVKGGGYNAPTFPLGGVYDDASMSFDPEQLDAYEVGFKHEFMDGKARLNGAAYYYDYNDYQTFYIVGIDTLTFNSDAESQGFELELQASPAEGWDILLGAAYNDIDVDLPDGRTTRPVQSPEWNMNAMVRYEWEIAQGGRVALQADSMYRSEHVFAMTGAETVEEDGYTISNVSLTYSAPGDQWQVSAFVENVTDEEYLVQTFDLSGTDVFGITEQYYGRPQWWGVSFKYNWGN